jgi:hypothetical protein
MGQNFGFQLTGSKTLLCKNNFYGEVEFVSAASALPYALIKRSFKTHAEV